MLAVAGLAAAILAPPTTAASATSSAPPFFAGCAAPTQTPAVVVGTVSCQELASPALGGTTA
ncbi:MAG TPA: hypothetical protein VF005_07845, partial [Acidimicrobiales bacterium]